jgi:hypothetical protein
MCEFISQSDHLQATGGTDAQHDIINITNAMRHRCLRDFCRRISGHWHKVSFDIVDRNYLSEAWIKVVAANAAFDNSMYETQGCLSAQQVFVEGSEKEVMTFTDFFIAEMKRILKAMPKGHEPFSGLREMYQYYEGKNGFVIATSLREMDEYPFCVIVDLAPTCLPVFNALNRSVVIRRIVNIENDIDKILNGNRYSFLMQSCGVALMQERIIAIAEKLGKAGVSRIVNAGSIWTMNMKTDSWDGYLTPLNLISPSCGHWTTIGFHDMDEALLASYKTNSELLYGCK